MTHGEEWGRRKRELQKKIENLEVKLDLSEIDLTAGLPPKMPRDKAARYYNEKLQRYWMEAGYYKKGYYPALKWIEYWIEKAYHQGVKDAKEAMNGSGDKE